jgi:hypothetical protein
MLWDIHLQSCEQDDQMIIVSDLWFLLFDPAACVRIGIYSTSAIARTRLDGKVMPNGTNISSVHMLPCTGGQF